MRISDWSSDVCSSDLVLGEGDALVDLTRFHIAVEQHVGQRRFGGPGGVRGFEPLGRLGIILRLIGELAGEEIIDRRVGRRHQPRFRSEEHTSELQSLMRISYAVFCLKKKKNTKKKLIQRYRIQKKRK